MMKLPLTALVFAMFRMACTAGPVPRIEFERRLTSVRKLFGFTEACLSACPGMSAAVAMFKKRDDEALAKEVCTHKDAFICAQNSGACDMGDSWGDYLKTLDCSCTDCPELIQAIGDIQGWFESLALQSSSSPDATPAPPSEMEMLSALCPAINPLQCAVNATSCASVVADLGRTMGYRSSAAGLERMDPRSLVSMEPACTQNGFKLEAEADFALSSSTTTATWLVVVACSVLFDSRTT